MAIQATSGKARSEINVTPLIDIVLVLLIIFIVMVPSLSRSLAASIPQKPTGEIKDAPTPIVLTLDAQGTLRLQTREVSLADLPDQLVEPLLKQPMLLRKVILKVDDELPYDRAVQVMDRVRVASLKVQQASRQRLGGEGSETKVVLAAQKRA